MEIGLLGPLVVAHDGAPVTVRGGKRRALLARLALEPGRVVSIERIVQDLWGEEPPSTAVKMVHIGVSQLRKALPGDRLLTTGGGYALEVDEAAVDAARFTRLRADGRAALDDGDAATAVALLSDALALWRGDALGEFEEPFAVTEAAHLEELRLVCVEDRFEASLVLGRHDDVIGELERSLLREPLRERLRRQHMLALYRSGRHAEALESYRRFRALLDAELGIEPSQRLRELERQILQQDPRLEPRPPTEPARAVAQRVASACVGRDQELGALVELLDGALAGRPAVAFVTGRAGLGKTTLVEAFLARAAASCVVARGQCFAQHGAGEAYMPVFDALGQLCRSERRRDLLASRAPTWLEQIPWLREHVVGVGAGTTRERMLRELVDALAAVAQDEPVVLVLEDLHWSDVSTIDVLTAMARRRDLPARLLLIGTFRPADARAAGHPVWEVARELCVTQHATEVALAPFAVEAVGEYVQHRLPGHALDPRFAGVLAERTGGDPLFVQALLDQWVSDGTVTPEGPSVGFDALAADVPATVRELIEHQLDQLAEPLLDAAAVAGREFAAATVAAALGVDDDEAERRLEELARRSPVFEPRGEAEWPDGTFSAQFGFAHDLYVEVAYARLPPSRRVRMHRAIGTRLEAAGAGPSELATHFLRGRDPVRAIRYLRLAAEETLRRSAHREAIAHLRTALELIEALPRDGERDALERPARTLLGAALIATEGYAAPEVTETYARALELAGDDAERMSSLYGLCVNAFVQGRHRDAVALGETYLELARERKDPTVVIALRMLGWPLLALGEFGPAVEHLQASLEAYRPERDSALRFAYGQDPGVAAAATSAFGLWFLGRPEQAWTRSEQAIARARALEHPLTLAYALGLGAMLAHLRRQVAAAEAYGDEAEQLTTEHGIPLWRAWGSVPRGWAMARRGDLAGGLDAIAVGLEGAQDTGARLFRSYALATLGEVHALAGDTKGALVRLEAALDVSDEYFYLAEIHRLRGELLGSEAALRTAVSTALAQHALMPALRASLALARAGQRPDALRGIVDRFTEGFGEPELEEAAALLA